MSKLPKVMAAHQPNFLPYLGFFDKLAKCDIFVIRDEVLFTDSDFHHRNRIRINGNDNINNPQSKWLTVPVIKQQSFIRDIQLRQDTIQKGLAWNMRILHDIEVNYSSSPHFHRFYPGLKEILINISQASLQASSQATSQASSQTFSQNPSASLLMLNMKLIRYLADCFNINTEIILASSLGLKGPVYEKSDPSLDLALIAEAVEADIYLSGDGGKGYLDLDPFNRRDIKVVYQDYMHPGYVQAYPGFVKFMSCIDYLFCIGPVLPRTEAVDAPQEILIEESAKV